MLKFLHLSIPSSQFIIYLSIFSSNYISATVRQTVLFHPPIQRYANIFFQLLTIFSSKLKTMAIVYFLFETFIDKPKQKNYNKLSVGFRMLTN